MDKLSPMKIRTLACDQRRRLDTIRSIRGVVTQGNTTTGVPNVTMTLTSPETTTAFPAVRTTATGSYAARVVAGSHTVTPSKTGQTFSPTSKTAIATTSSVVNVNFKSSP